MVVQLHNVLPMTKTPTPQAHLNSAEVCERLHIDRSTLSRWVAAGRITPAIKLPGKRGPFLFDPSEVERVAEAAA